MGNVALRLLVSFVLVIVALMVVRAMVMHQHQERASAPRSEVDAVVARLNARDARGLMDLLAPDHRQGDAERLIGVRDRLGPIASYSDSGTVELNVNGAVSMQRIYTVQGAHGTGRLELDLASRDGGWDLVGVHLDDQAIPSAGAQAPARSAPPAGGHGTIDL